MDGGYYTDSLFEATLITDIFLPNLGIFRHLDLSFHAMCYSPLLRTTPPAGSIDSLESVKLYFKTPDNFLLFGREDPITVAGARNLQKVEFQSNFYLGWFYTLARDVLHLPWAQLTDLRFGTAVAPTTSRAHAILRQSTKLVNCTMNLTKDETPISPNHSVSTVICPLLESLNLIFIHDASVAMFLQPLVLSTLIDLAFTIDGSLSCEQPELLSLIQRSMCSITSVTIGSWLSEIANEELLEELPSLKELNAEFLLFSSDILDRLSSRDLLPNLEILHCQVDSSGSFVDMLNVVPSGQWENQMDILGQVFG
jgi:hypothetical protein